MTGSKVNIKILHSDESAPLVLSCDTCWSVEKLKEVIQSDHSFKPEVSRQTLIYKGRCLDNAEALDSFLQMSDSVHTVHLALSARKKILKVPASTPSSDGLRHRQTSSSSEPNSAWQQWQQWQNYQYYQQHPSTPEQYSAMWQQYQQQINDYMRYYNSQVAKQQPTQPSPTNDAVTQPAAAPNPQPAPADVAPANIPDPPMNAQGGFAPADNDDAAPHDWLDFLFTLFRYSFFLSIIYFYSTFWRFLFVAGFFLLLYVYQSGLFQAQRRPPHRDEVRREEARPPAAENTDDNNNQNEEDNVNANSSTEELPVPPPSIFATAWCFITTFFTSLIPQPPPVV